MSNNYDQHACIHQYLIDLDCNKSIDEVRELLMNAQESLGEDIEINLINELFSLIQKCFSLFPKDFIPILENMIENSKTNSYFTIITAAILSYYIQNNYSEFISDYDQFVNDCLNEILPQIQNSYETQIFIFQHEIPLQFKNDFLLNLVLSSRLTKTIINQIVIHLIDQNWKRKCCQNKIVFLIHKIINTGLTDLIAPYLPNDGNFYSLINIEDLAIIIPLIPNQSFKKNFKQFEKIFLKSSDKNLPFIEALFQKCDELNIKLKSIKRVFDFLTSKEIKPSIINHIKKYDVVLPIETARKFIDHPDHQFVFNIAPTLTILPKQMICDSILQINDIKFYQSLFSLGNFVSPVLTTPKFYAHIFTVLGENKNKITPSLIKDFAKTFQKFIERKDFINIIDEIVLSLAFNNQNIIDIVFDFINKLDYDFKELYNEREHMNKYINTIMEMKNIPSTSFIKFIDNYAIATIIAKRILLNQEISSRLYFIYKFSSNLKIPIKYKISQPKDSFGPLLIKFIKENDFELLQLIDDESLKFILQALIFAENEQNMIYGLTNKTILPFYAIVLNNLKINVDIFENEKNMNLFMETMQLMIDDQSPIAISSIDSILHSFKTKSTNKLTNIKVKMMDIFIELLLTHKCNTHKSAIISYITSDINNLKHIKSNLNDFIKFMISENKLENIIFMNKFMERAKYFTQSHHTFKIPSNYYNIILNKFIPLFENKILNENVENNSSLISLILNRMILNPSLKKCYLITYLQSHDTYHLINKNDLIHFVYREFCENENVFLEIFKHVYINHAHSYNYIKKRSFDGDEFFNVKFEIEKNVINDLFGLINSGKMKSQAFICLKGIACTFPFLFDLNPVQIFDMVLPEINYFSTLFDDEIDENMENEENAKTAICAYSFLISTLHSNKIMDTFINWYFSNIEKFNHIQNYCFNHIFFSILKNERLKRVVVASLLKYNYIDILLKLMKNDIPNRIFSDNYKILLCKILNEFINSKYKFNNADILAIDELQKIEFPFLHEFNNFKTFLPSKIIMFTKKDFSKIPKTKLNQKLWKFMEEIEKIKPFWYEFEFPNTILPHKYFIMKTNNPNVDVKYYFYNFMPLPISALRVVFQKSAWMYEWITKDIKSPLFKDEYEMLRETLENIDLNMEKYQNDPILAEFNTDDYFSQHFSENKLFDISNYILIPNNGFIFISKLISNILHNNKDPSFSLNILAQNFDVIKERYIENEDTFKYFSRFLSVLVEVSNLESFKENIDKFENNLFELALNPKYRNDIKVLSKIADILINVSLDEILIISGDVINFMYLSGNDDLVYKAIRLSEMYFDELIEKHMKIINKLFNNLVKKKPFQSSKIYSIARIIPSFNDLNINIILFDNIIQNFNDFGDKKEIIKLINKLTPDRDTYDLDTFSDIQQLYNDQDPPVPQSMIDSDPIFWNYFIENRAKINKIINENNLTFFNDNFVIDGNNTMISLKLFDDYPQLYSFDFRYKLFYNKIRKEMKNENIFELFIDRENILESSFDQLKDFSEDDWKCHFQIHFIGEQGLDFGGLRRDWFISVSKALFNTDLSLFSISENMTIQPSIQSYANPNHLQLFKFAGYLVAKAILQGEHIDGHFSHAFLCNILELKTGLEDIKELSPCIYNSLDFILNNDIDEYDLDLYFAIDYNNFDDIKTFEFVENGSQIKVTNENKNEYVKYMIDYLTQNSIEYQNHNFFDGFDSLIPYNYIKIFTPNELDLIISGISLIDVEDIKRNTEYEYPYSSDSPTVVLFFNCIKKWNQNDLEKLINFITGSPKVPFNGFQHYKNIGIPLKIQSGGEKKWLPTSHTCFNILSLPEYETEDELNFKFHQAFCDDSFNLQ